MLQYLDFGWENLWMFLLPIYIGITWYSTLKAHFRNARLADDNEEKLSSSFLSVIAAPLIFPIALMVNLTILLFKSLLFLFFLPIFILFLVFDRIGSGGGGGGGGRSRSGWLRRLGEYILENSWWIPSSSSRRK